MSESVELATVLLIDLVGSTRLATSVGPVPADQLREEHFGLLRDVIAACEHKEVKNTGDGLIVAFASASAAVRCAVSMQQLFECRYSRAPRSAVSGTGLTATREQRRVAAEVRRPAGTGQRRHRSSRERPVIA